MSTVEDSVPGAKLQLSDVVSAPRLIIVAFGWILLAMAPAAAGGFVRGFATGFVRGINHGASQLEITPTVSHLLTTVGASGFAIVLLYSAWIRGRIVGDGDRRLGLGLAPIEKLPVVIGLSIVLVAYAALIDFAIYQNRPEIFFQSSSVALWLTLTDGLTAIILAPLAEELFFRGWLWTGLWKRWGPWLTSLITAAIWLALHLERGVGYVMLLLLPAIILTAARQVGRSVRVTIPMHAIYNLAANVPLIALLLKLIHS
jgi:membrane protease YdiL (CAAX protease family)